MAYLTIYEYTKKPVYGSRAFFVFFVLASLNNDRLLRLGGQIGKKISLYGCIG